MFDFISNLTGLQIAGFAGLLFIIVNYLLAHFKIVEKYNKWIDKIKPIIQKVGTNIGVFITGWGNNIKWLGKTYEKCVEGLIIMVLRSISLLLVTFIDSIIEGLRSDNTEYKKLKDK